MIQKKSYPRWERKEPWRFIPRRDLFPDAEIPAHWEQNIPKTEDKINSQYTTPTLLKRGNEVKKVRRSPLPENHSMIPVKAKGRRPVIQPEFLLMFFVFFFIMNTKQSIFGTLSQSQSIQMLKSIGPYLGRKEQNAVYTAAGMMEAMQLIKDVANGNYHSQNQVTLMHIPSNPTERRLEAMKAIKPYFRPKNRKQLDQVLNFYESASKVQRNIALYKNNRTLAGEQKLSPVETAGELLKIIHPVLPNEQKEKASKAMQVIKMMEAVGAADKLSRSEKKTKNENKVDKQNIEDGEEQSTQKQIEKMMDSFAPMLNDEQKESMDMIMKMAQLLSQPNEENN